MGDLIFSGCRTTDLARTFGTPLYVMSEDIIRAKIREIRAAFDLAYDRCVSHYASKAFITRDMVRIVRDEGMGLDVVSGGELALALAEGTDPRNITFHGNSKTDQEIAEALRAGVGLFVCDSVGEIHVIAEMARSKQHTADVLIRVNPGTESDTHSNIATSGGSKFGVAAEDVADAVRACLALPEIRLRGFHFHVGSQLMDATSHISGLDVVLAVINAVRQETGYAPDTLDMGGGFGVVYTEEDRPADIRAFLSPLVERAERAFSEMGITRPTLMIEPGRFIVAEAGITLYSVGSIKPDRERLWIGVDGGYPDNVRTEMYGARYRAVLAGRADEPADIACTVAGKCCESGDVVIWDILLPRPKRGDVLAVFTTGAYCYTMSNNYNMNPRPALVMIRDGVPRLSVRRQTYERMFEDML